MKFIRLYLIVVLLASGSGFYAQHKKKIPKELKKEAQFSLDSEDYYTALQLQKKILLLDSENEMAGVNSALCINKLSYPIDSAVFLQKNLSVSKLPDARYFLAIIKHQLSLFDEAVALLDEYVKTDEKKRIASVEDMNHLIDQCRNAKAFKSSPHRSVIKNIGANINSAFPDYVPVILPDESAIYFTSKRNSNLHPQRNADNKFFEDIYVSYNLNGVWKAAENAGFPLNTETNDACVAISPDGQRMIIYRTAADQLTGDLYLTRLSKHRWTEPVRMGNAINSEYIETSACFSGDTSEIYFSSDRPGGIGGKDIYRIKKLPNGNWGAPFNLGPNINTKYDEDAPFLHVDGVTLYFSSKGHNTMGDFDIFKSTNTEGQFAAAENLGYPINDVASDIFFVLSVDGKRGYYSSQKKDTHGGVDIYQIDTRFGDNDLVVKQGNALLDGTAGRVKITLVDSETNEVSGYYFSNPDSGKFILVTNPLKFYKATAEADGFVSEEFDIIPLTERNKNELLIKLKKSAE